MPTHRLPLLCLFLISTAQAAPDPPLGLTEFQTLVASFGQINTIAGRGFADNCNGWNPAWEGTSPASATELSRPHMAQADAAGNVYIADKEGHAIRMVTPEGTIHTIAGNGTRADGGEGLATSIPLLEPNGLFTFPDGTTYILETNNQCGATPIPGGKIRLLQTNGLLSTIITDPTLLGGRGLWVSPDQSLIFYSSLTEIKKWTPTAGLETYSSGFTELGNIDINPITGLLCATDRGANRVYQISADGSTRSIIAGNGNTGAGSPGLAATDCALDEVRGIAFRPDGSYFVCTHKGDHAVWFIDTSGFIWKLIDGANNAHSGDGTQISTFPQNVISEPRAITIAPNGDLLITEKDEGHVRRITNLCIEPKITALNLNANNFTITWLSQREGSYNIEKSTDLNSWSTVESVNTPTSPTTSITLQTTTTQEFYRIAQE